MSMDKSLRVYNEYSTQQTYSCTLSEKAEYYLYVKRAMDIVLSLIGLAVTLPVILVFCVIISIETPGSPFYRQERVGKDGKHFKLYKLRSMRMDAEKSGATWARKNDPRITSIGAFIRKTRIDELPQLVNVLIGDMSLVGPRPERPIFTAKFQHDIPGFQNRLVVKPGLTGLAQVNGGYDISPREKLVHDLYYIRNMTFLLDLKVIIKTFKVVLTGDGAR
ncbi:exopolysaccharide biosynthesis polyprenyl glycosylphosphotransferase [Bacillus sp. WMMC1349]|uniref:sugar transferase n=1 Tax=Bacillus sp. WMMC1349 TaxID=2736254 RepID=UPI001551BF64|nr:exopolysaccharide biosynthesis polyprenyl glycosylphosphotransferase [Bacillus sp. WMMC1349]NPC94341.1 exopolysaccharide biosynthesis polyprenyl glycosylphosphotransferase [Bacillus sp. WMMC1349]